MQAIFYLKSSSLCLSPIPGSCLCSARKRGHQKKLDLGSEDMPNDLDFKWQDDFFLYFFLKIIQKFICVPKVYMCLDTPFVELFLFLVTENGLHIFLKKIAPWFWSAISQITQILLLIEVFAIFLLVYG